MATSVVTPTWRILAEGLHRDYRRWRTRRGYRSNAPYVVPIRPTGVFIVAELSTLTGRPLRYWRGTDRDHWTPDKVRARVFPTAEVAERTAQQHLLQVYRPDYTVLHE